MSIRKRILRFLGSKEEELQKKLEQEREAAAADRFRRREGMREMQAKLREAEIARTRQLHPPIDDSGQTQAQYCDRLRRDAIEADTVLWDRVFQQGRRCAPLEHTRRPVDTERVHGMDERP